MQSVCPGPVLLLHGAEDRVSGTEADHSGLHDRLLSPRVRSQVKGQIHLSEPSRYLPYQFRRAAVCPEWMRDDSRKGRSSNKQKRFVNWILAASLSDVLLPRSLPVTVSGTSVSEPTRR